MPESVRRADAPAEVRCDVVIIGSGAGGGTLAHALADTGVSVLLLERGDWLPMEPENADPVAVWQRLRYRADETWINRGGAEFRPFMHYVVGGNTKMWGSALLRLRSEDFRAVEHGAGVSPPWPIDYQALAPWYDAAERLYHVHGAPGDPTDPPRGDFPYPPLAHEPAMQEIVDGLIAQGLHPSHLPIGVVSPGEQGGCLLCDTCNSFPCQVRAKSDTDVICVTDAVKADNVSLWTGARAERLRTDASGDRVTAVDVDRDGARSVVRAGTVVLSAGAVNSAALLLRSANDKHPHGLANSSDLVGRRYMAHLATMMEAVHPTRRNPTVFQKTVAINDFYLGTSDRPPLGHIQSQGRAHAAIVQGVVPWLPNRITEAWVERGVDWLAMSEDLPDPDNRVTLTDTGRIRLDYRPNNMDAHKQLVRETVRALRRLGYWHVVRHRFKNENTTHQCGTAVFGNDPRSSALDPWCRAHDLENLYVVDASFFPSSGAVNPGLTIIAQALRVADHLRRTVLNHATTEEPESNRKGSTR